MAFNIEFSPRAMDNLRRLRKRDQQIIVDAIAAQLTHPPGQSTRQRKKLEDNELAPWELLYDIVANDQMVIILAIGKKTHNILRIGDEEIDLGIGSSWRTQN